MGSVLLPWPQHSWLLDDAHRIAYCPIPKVMCSNLKILLLEHAGIAALHGHGDFNRCRVHGDIHSCAARELGLQAADRLRSFRAPDTFRFAFVRNPWARLVSAYLDKIARFGQGAVGATRSWIERAQRASGRELDLRRRISFREFVGLVCTLPDHQLDEHWRPQHTFLAGEPMDWIGRYEERERALPDLLRRLGIDRPFGSCVNTVGYGALPAPGARPMDWDAVELEDARQHLDGFPPWESFYDHALVEAVAQRFRSDVLAFGYHAPTPDPLALRV